MKADLSRSTFAAAKHYRDVRLQQGRVQLDADFNEYVDIAAHRIETETVDTIGRSGAPVHDAGFALAASVAALPLAQQAAATALGALVPGDFFVSAGRFYCEGVLCENETPFKYSAQGALDLPDAEPLREPGLYLAYLDVWARHLTFLDDPALREIALNGPDTATRNKTVWQLKLIRVGPAGTPADCSATFAAYTQAVAAGTGRLAARAEPDEQASQPCILPAGAGYRRLENQLYRVEIHDAGTAGGTATFKWSRDNGAIVSGWSATAAVDTIRLSNPPRDQVLGFTVGQWVELLDDTNDLLQTPGALFEIRGVKGDLLTLDRAAPAPSSVDHPKVRRWDSLSEIAVTSGAWLALEDGVEVKFTTGSYQTGDHWLIPARTATSDVEWPQEGNLPASVAPHGVRHRHARVGFVEFATSGLTITDCRPLFTPLTELKPGGDLKLHNKHLHGSGVVCGLQVHCAGDREGVRIEPGHAIDCEGTDILLKAAQFFPVVERAKALSLLDAAGDGDVLLTLKADALDAPVFDLRAAEDAADSSISGILQKILQGTLWMDFYQDCLKPLVDFVRAQFTTKDPADVRRAPVQRRRLLAAMNLLVHQTKLPAGQRVWLSREEHELLENLHQGIVGLASGSRTFCGIADDLPAFPAYPFEKHSIRTAFSSLALTGLRADPAGWSGLVYGFGSGEESRGKLYLFDVETGELVNVSELKALTGLTVQDVAFVLLRQKPAVLVAAVPEDGSRTVLAFLEPQTLAPLGETIELVGGAWSKLEAVPAGRDHFLAVRKGVGLYFVAVDQLVGGTMAGPRVAFDAAGHLAVLGSETCATVSDGSGGERYNALRFGRIFPRDLNFDDSDTSLSKLEQGASTGEDAIAYAMSPTGLALLHVVINPLPAQLTKAVLIVQSRRLVGRLDLPAIDAETGHTGKVSLAASSTGGYVVIGLRERNELLWTKAGAGKSAFTQTLPAQMAPGALAASAGEQTLVVLNEGSQTLTLIPDATVEKVPAPEAEIIAYRDEVLAAFTRLVAVLVQQLKDCLCDHLLVDCPECGPDEYLVLAHLHVRQGRVYHICNFERREVLTFPKVKYWLSAVPLIPLISFLAEKFCCYILPQLKADPAAKEAQFMKIVPAEMITTALSFMSGGAAKVVATEQIKRVQGVAAHYLRTAQERVSLRPAATTVPTVELLEQSPSVADAKLTKQGVKVTAVHAYDEALAARDAEAFSGDKLPLDLKTGDSVKLYVKNDRVVFYTRVAASESATVSAGGTAGASGAASPKLAPTAPTAPTASLADANRLREDLNAVKTQLAQMQLTHTQELVSRDREIADLKVLAQSASSASTLAAQLHAAQSDVQALRAEFATLKTAQLAPPAAPAVVATGTVTGVSGAPGANVGVIKPKQGTTLSGTVKPITPVTRIRKPKA